MAVALTMMILLMSFIAALGLWDFYLDEMINASSAFWVAIALAWAVSMFSAGFVSSLAARSQTKLEGMLNAVTSCCGSYLLFGLLALIFTPRVVVSLLGTASPQFFLRLFLVDLVGFVVGLYGGVVAIHFEGHSFDLLGKKRKTIAA
jgi:hypothetical protein